jgi:hypothetical protein
VKIRFHKLSDARHELEILRPGAPGERVSCETRSYLVHDLLHFATESEARLESGFYGRLASGVTLAALNDRTNAMGSPELAPIEQVVGMLSGSVKGLTTSEMMATFERYEAAMERALPAWVTAELVARVEERMRSLLGRYRATAFGSFMELEWPGATPPARAT